MGQNLNITRPSNPFSDYLLKVEEYVQAQPWQETDVLSGQDFQVVPLAKGEYNLNYLLKGRRKTLVFRVNMGTQIERDDQILYEFKALQLLEKSGVTPVPYFVDDSRTFIDRGISIMEYLPFILLRGISWSAMGWVAYQTDYNGVRDEHTWQTLQRYMNIDFIRSLFSPFIHS